jgi:nucleoside-diphosphate kinase
MSGNHTFTILKPDAVRKGYTGAILDKILSSGFHVCALKLVKLNRHQAQDFYSVHKGKPFYEGLIEFMISGPVVVAILGKENAVEEFRTLIGSTDPSKAAPGTIRQLYAETMQFNAVHGSDSDENAKIEADFFFSRVERFPQPTSNGCCCCGQ